MKTEEIAISRLTENEDNPRQITDENFAKLVRSILSFPKMLEIRPVVTDGTFKVLGGNMRTRALGKIRTMDAAAIRKELDGDGRFTEGEKLAILEYWNVWKENPTVKIVKADDLTEAQKREFIIKDNAGFGEWDTDRLANEWNDVPLTEWGVPDWVTCQQEGEGEEECQAHEDNWKENEAAPRRVNKGEIWQLGDHRLMCGDSTNGDHVKELCGGEKIQLLITDPPYNVNYGQRSGTRRKAIANDNMTGNEFQEFLFEALVSADDVMVEGGHFIFGMHIFRPWLFSERWAKWDGRTPSKSFGSKITLCSDEATTSGYTSRAYTDGKRERRIISVRTETCQPYGRMKNRWITPS